MSEAMNEDDQKNINSPSQSSPTNSSCNNTNTNMSEGEESEDQMDSTSESTAKVSSTLISTTVKCSSSNNLRTSGSVEPEGSHSDLAAKDKEISDLEDTLNEKSSTIKELEEKLESQRDYDKIKRELNNLKTEIAQLKAASCLSNSLDPKALEMYVSERTKALLAENAALKAANSELAGGRLMSHSSRHPILPSPFVPPLQNVEVFSSFLGEEIANTYAKVFKQAAANGNNNSSSVSPRPASVDDAKSTRSDASPTVTSNEETSSVKALTGSSPPLLDVKRPDGSSRASLDRLQTCLRANIEKYMHENLNTMNISRCVRELLSVHNIGQRLFAKYVLGLSQGTVSELLSKPKPWDKLTEKGRDSYRKMHAWAADESCIYQLKALVPRKGKESAPFKQDDPAAEERIQQILSEAQRAMVTPRTNGAPRGIPFSFTNGVSIVDREKLNNQRPDLSNRDMDDGSSSDGGDDREPSTTCTPVTLGDAKKDGDVISPEMVVRMYQEELAKMIGAQVDGDGRGSQGSKYDRSQDEIRQALAIYHQELSRLSHLASSGAHLPPGSDTFARLASCGMVNGSPPFMHNAMDALAAFDARRGRVTSSSASRKSDINSNDEHHSSAFQLVRPKLESDRGSNVNTKQRFVSSPSPLFASINQSNNNNSNQTDSGAEDLSAAASPLQRMQSITNSLLTQSSVPVAPSTPSRPAKAVLPPITQQQFDQYNNLNTEDIVKNVKEQLSQFSISQRLFGESVLGLSQGSVSDLLARPKPWHMLTQKGREPFIRMKMFLEDESAVHKLVASQYKIAPEKLMRSSAGNFGNPMAPTPQTTLATAHLGPGSTLGASLRRPDSRPEMRKIPSPLVDSLRSAGSTPEYPNSTSALLAQMPLQTIISGSPGGSHRRPVVGLGSRSNPGYAQPSVYEMAALTTDLDTQAITTKIKETLMAHNIGQKIFGEVVLGLSQGSVSELLSKPKPWHMLSIKGREPFIRMQLWLTDPNNIEKLQSLKNERREANKRRRTNGDDGPRTLSSRDSPLYSFSNNSSGFSPLSSSQGFNSSFGAASAKKPRILFSEEQKEALRLAFSMDPYPSTATIEYLAGELRLSVRTITNWFHNHRMRLKQVSGSSGEEVTGNMSLAFGLGRDGVTFDPVTFKVALTQRLADIKFRGPGSDHGGAKGYFGSSSISSQMYDNQNSCSSPESSIQGDDEMGTLDLSMTTNANNTKPANSHRSFGDSDGSNDSGDYEEAPSPPPVKLSGSSRRKPQHVTSSSSRRKPAQPQWVDPGRDFSGDDDEDDFVGSDNEADGYKSEVINGVCVRQTDFESSDKTSKAAVAEKVTTRKSSIRSSNYSDAEEEEQEPKRAKYVKEEAVTE